MIINEVSSVPEKAHVTVEGLTVLMERVEVTKPKLDKLDAEIEPHLPTEGIEEEYSRIVKYEDVATHALARLGSTIKGFSAPPKEFTQHQITATTEQSVPPPTESSPVAELNTSVRSTRGIKLQKLDLYIFSGDMLAW